MAWWYFKKYVYNVYLTYNLTFPFTVFIQGKWRHITIQKTWTQTYISALCETAKTVETEIFINK